MSELYHYGILGMHWGIRRTPEELGHAPKGSKKESGMSSKRTKSASMTDDELRQKILRMNLEEQYENLVKREQERRRGPGSKYLEKAIDRLTDRAIGACIDELIEAAKDQAFSIDDWLTRDVDDMSYRTMKRVSSWYATRGSIQKLRGY